MVHGQDNAKNIILCIISGILLALPYNNGGLWILSWFGFVPLFFALQNKPPAKRFLLACLSGVIFWSLTVYWLVHVTLLGSIILVFYLSLYFGCFGILFLRKTQDAGLKAILFIPSEWVILEYIRSYLLTGFPWALLGYSQYLNLPIIQISDITGTWGVSFLVMAGNVFVMRIAYCVLRKKPLFKTSSALFLVIFLLSLIYGYYKLSVAHSAKRKAQSAIRPTLKISLIQPNIPQELKWRPEARPFIMEKIIGLTEEAYASRPDLIIWPEAALPVILEEQPVYFERTKGLVERIKTPLLFGSVTRRRDIYYNSAIFISGNGRLTAVYDKIHLVPFGEYIPLRNIFPFLQTIAPIGDITAGKVYSVFELNAIRTTHDAIRFSVLICFEDLFPELSREFVRRGAQFLINITNDAWYKDTPAARQHLMASVFRAVESRVFLLRSANTGVSAVISAQGAIVAQVADEKGKDICIEGFIAAQISPRGENSFYNKHGDLFIIFCLLLFLYGILTPSGKSLLPKHV